MPAFEGDNVQSNEEAKTFAISDDLEPEDNQPLLGNDKEPKLASDKEIELKKRNWWIIEGKAYDFKNFVDRHPGGRDAIMLAKGLDCTELFKTYHIMKTPPDSLLKKYEVKLDQPIDFGTSKYTFEQDGFIMTTRRRVREYFETNKLSTKGNIGYQIHSIIGVLACIALLYPAFILGFYWAALLHGFVKGTTAVIGGHGMSHFSLFDKKYCYLNTLLFRVFSPFVLSSHQVWSTSHIVSHHIDTLTPEDLQDNYPVKRVQPALKHMWFHRFQHLYIWLVYLLGLPLWTLSDVVHTAQVIFTGKHHMRYLPLLTRLENFISITANLFITVFLPFVFLPFTHALVVTLLSNVPSSLLLVVQIAVNHEVPDTMGKISPDKKIDWGTHQVITSHNFGVDSKIALHLSGGLNMQIEHHLFPGVHYSHYPAIGHIIRQACQEYNLPYNTSKHIFEAVYKHYQVLKINSKP